MSVQDSGTGQANPGQPNPGGAKLGRISVPELVARKGKEPIVCLTAYTTPMAQALDPHVDLLLVGDSLGMVLYGFESTLQVTLDMMIAHGAAVKRGSKRACLVVDMPFGSYQESTEQAFRNAVKIMRETGCSAVKMEGGRDLAPTVAFLVKRGIPVMGHVGLMPQQINTLGGYRARGRAHDEAAGVMADAIAIAEAGAFSIVVEGVLEQVAQAITARVPVPTIGIGASADCDGQVLVAEDMLGLFGAFKPRFVKRYAELAGEIGSAAASYAADVRGRRFPGPENVFGSLKKSS
jgi:3-methyl-2-oxobutanoate hydroxymethyltransferase